MAKVASICGSLPRALATRTFSRAVTIPRPMRQLSQWAQVLAPCMAQPPISSKWRMAVSCCWVAASMLAAMLAMRSPRASAFARLVVAFADSAESFRRRVMSVPMTSNVNHCFFGALRAGEAGRS